MMGVPTLICQDQAFGDKSSKVRGCLHSMVGQV